MLQYAFRFKKHAFRWEFYRNSRPWTCLNLCADQEVFERKYGHHCPVGTGRMICPQTQLVPARGSLDVSYQPLRTVYFRLGNHLLTWGQDTQTFVQLRTYINLFFFLIKKLFNLYIITEKYYYNCRSSQLSSKGDFVRSNSVLVSQASVDTLLDWSTVSAHRQADLSATHTTLSF